MSNQIIGYGATVERSTDGIVFERIPECKSVSVPSSEQDYVDVTSLDSPDGYREYIPGLKDMGEISLTVGYTVAGYTQQLADQNRRVATYYRTTLASQPGQVTGDVFEFRGFPRVAMSDGSVEGALEMTVTIRTTGNLIHTPGDAA